MWQVLGRSSNPARTDQFTPIGQGIWLTATRRPKPSPLPPAFGLAFERYLIYLNVDPSQPLPASYLFSNEYSNADHDLTSLWRMMCSVIATL